MPTYVYRCSCGEIFERLHAMDYTGPITCPECGSDQTQKIPCAPAVVLDWHNFDYDDGALAQVGSRRFRGSAVPRSAREG